MCLHLSPSFTPLLNLLWSRYIYACTTRYIHYTIHICLENLFESTYTIPIHNNIAMHIYISMFEIIYTLQLNFQISPKQGGMRKTTFCWNDGFFFRWTYFIPTYLVSPHMMCTWYILIYSTTTECIVVSYTYRYVKGDFLYTNTLFLWYLPYTYIMCTFSI